MNRTLGKSIMIIEICNECGRSVKIGSGLLINRVIDLDEIEVRKENNKPFPKGDFMCHECDEKIRRNVRN